MVRKKDLKKALKEADLEGFKDIMDLISDGQSNLKKFNVSNPQNDTPGENLKLLNLLEHEQNRLEKLKNIVEDKHKGQVGSSWQKDLIRRQLKHRDKLRNDLIEYMRRPDSNFHCKFSKFLNTLF